MLIEIKKSMDGLIKISKFYKPLTVRAAKFFFLSQDLVKLNPLYQFTHSWFKDFFQRQLEIVSQNNLLDRSNKDKMVKKVRKAMTLDFFKEICNTLFEQDQLLVSFILAYKDLESEYTTDMRQVEFFIKGRLAQEDEIYAERNEEKEEDEV